MRLLYLLCATTLVACVGATEPRNFHCLYVGDTVGVIAFHDSANIITSCTFIVQKVDECDPAIDARRLFHASDCVVGEQDG